MGVPSSGFLSLLVLFFSASAFAKTTLPEAHIEVSEVKVSIAPEDLPKLKTSLGLAQENPIHQTIYFFDTDAQDLLRKGLIVRARKNGNEDYLIVIKVRTGEPSQLNAYAGLKGIEFEDDVLTNRRVHSGAIRSYISQKKMEKVLRDKVDLWSVFSRAQKNLFQRVYGPKATKTHKFLQIAGPIASDKWVSAEGQSLEDWSLPDGRHLVELSKKVPIAEEAAAMARLGSLAKEAGIELAYPETKTKEALTSSKACELRYVHLKAPK